MTRPTTWKTFEDGSIDTDHYLARGRQMRSDEAYRMIGGLKNAMTSVFGTAAKSAQPTARTLRLRRA